MGQRSLPGLYKRVCPSEKVLSSEVSLPCLLTGWGGGMLHSVPPWKYPFILQLPVEAGEQEVDARSLTGLPVCVSD